MGPRVEFDTADTEVSAYRLMTSLVVPRPIAWVSTLSAEGVGNLAPHSFFNVASADPPMLMFTSIGRKDTLNNIEATGEFTICVASEPMLDDVNNSGARFDAHTSEAERLDIELEPSRLVAPPRVAHSPAAFECTLHEIVHFPHSAVIFGQVRLIAVDEAVMEDGHPRIDRVRPLSRLGRNEWGLPPRVVAIDRPARPEDIGS